MSRCLVSWQGPHWLLPHRDEDQWGSGVPRRTADNDGNGPDVSRLRCEKPKFIPIYVLPFPDHFHHPIVGCHISSPEPWGARTLLPRSEFSRIFYLWISQINEHLGAATVSLTDMSKLQFCQATIGEMLVTKLSYWHLMQLRSREFLLLLSQESSTGLRRRWVAK